MKRLLTPLSFGILLAALVCVHPAPASARLVRLFAELDGGVGLPTDDNYGQAGFATKAMFGVGGRFRVVPLAIYGFVGIDWNHYERTHEGLYHRAELLSNDWTLSFGARFVFRFARRFRIVADVAGGYHGMHARGTIDGRDHLVDTTGEPVPIFGIGIQYRLLRHLALGLRGDFTMTQEGRLPDLPALAAGLAPAWGEQWQSNLFLTATFDF